MPDNTYEYACKTFQNHMVADYCTSVSIFSLFRCILRTNIIYMLRSLFFLLFLCTNCLLIKAQHTYSIKGIVKEATSGEPVSYATVMIWNGSQGAVSDSVGHFVIEDVKPGSYRLQVSYLGYKTLVSPEFEVTNKDMYMTTELETASQQLEGVNVVATPFRKLTESPLGMRVIGLKEIEKSAGGNRDISRVVQTFPGVASTAAFRNDLMVRGGGPSENRFYLDGVEIPSINHFATQGASGGPVGIINPDFIREVNFYSAAFPASRGNALSSVLDFKMKEPNPDKYTLRGVVGASEVGLSANGPISPKTTFQVSIRRSYLQFLFDMIGLPFLPTFTDAQFRIKHQFNQRNELILLGLGAIDDMKLNTNMPDMSEENQYILSYLPVVKQKTYTLGAVYKHYSGKNSYSLILSRSLLNNKNKKYKDNDESLPENLTLDYQSDEIVNSFRSENTFRLPFLQINAGGNLGYNQYRNDTYQKRFSAMEEIINYNTDLNLFLWGLYATANYESPNERFTASLGFRVDANNYSPEMNNPLKQFSPRLSLSYRLSSNLYLNGATGRYYELPPYTTMGFKDPQGVFVNKQNQLRYICSDQFSAGVEYHPFSHLKVTAEGFYKKYDHYPMSLADSIPLASKGTDYGVLGDEAVTSTSSGHAYGFEVMGRWYNYKGITFIASYTYVRSEFKDDRNANRYIPTAWDNRHLFTFSGTWSLPRNWDVGAKLRVVGGAPYTPYDLEKSSLVTAADAGRGLYYDYTQYNSLRLDPFTQLDVRVDKTFYFKKLMLGIYIDLQNVMNSKYRQPDVYLKTGNIINPEAPVNEQRYEMKAIKRSSGTLLPGIGIIIEI